jgi:putative dimethyl sulfoxide reductase chaperone
METNQLDIKSSQGMQAGCRSRLYCLLAKGFGFPSAAQYERIRDGQFANEAQKAAVNLPYNSLPLGQLGKGDEASYEEFQSNYIGLFEVGGRLGAPCFLYEGEYGGGRMNVMEEILRFYHHFGLRLSEEKRDRPDHLASEMEFMHVLTFKEAEAVNRGVDSNAYLQAQRAFLQSHLADFTASVAARVASARVPFYSELAELANGFCRSDLAYLTSTLNGGQHG